MALGIFYHLPSLLNQYSRGLAAFFKVVVGQHAFSVELGISEEINVSVRLYILVEIKSPVKSYTHERAL